MSRRHYKDSPEKIRVSVNAELVRKARIKLGVDGAEAWAIVDAALRRLLESKPEKKK